MKPLGHVFLLAALDLARASDATPAHPSAPEGELGSSPSREEIAAAWRRWAEADGATREPPRRGLGLPAPRPGI